MENAVFLFLNEFQRKIYTYYFLTCKEKPTVKKNNCSCCALKVCDHKVEHE